MEDLLKQLKESLQALLLISYKLYVFCKDKIQAFILMLKKIFSKKKKLS